MKLARALAVLAALAAACGGRSRESETGQSGAAGAAGSNACAEGKDAYQKQRTQVLETLTASGCNVDADCGSLWETNACVSTCGTTTPAAGIHAAAEQLSAFAQDACETCPPIPDPPCIPPRPIKCLQGTCGEQQ